MISKYHRLNLKVKQIQEDMRPTQVAEAAEQLVKTISEINTMTEEAFSAVEGARYDARFLVSSTSAANQLSNLLQTDSKSFDPNEFSGNLLRCLKGEAIPWMEPIVTSQEWAAFGKRHGQILNPVPSYRFIYGSFEPEKVIKESAKRIRRISDWPLKVMVKPLHVNSKETVAKVGEDQTVVEVEKLYRTLKQRVKKSGHQAIPYFELVTDRHSFSKTVENIFHSAFLIKEGEVTVEMGSYESDLLVPVIKPVKAKKKSNEVEEVGNAESSQSILSFSMADWRRWTHNLSFR